jgi:hypothetical protein
MQQFGLSLSRSICSCLGKRIQVDLHRERKLKNIIAKFVLLAAVVILGVAPVAHAQGGTVYTSDPNITDFTSQVTTFATFANFSSSQCAVEVALQNPPTASELATYGCRVYGGTFTAGDALPANNWILATFPTAVSSIIVFPNIDHFGSAYDGYQYQIEGSNDLENWTPLFNPTAVTGSGEIGANEPFTLSEFTGTRPTVVNNVLTPQSIGLPSGCTGTATPCAVGYIATFNFPAAYQYYVFGASTVANGNNPSPNPDQELSAVGTASVTVHLGPGTSTGTAFFFPNGDETDPAAHAFSVTTDVTNPNGIDVTITPHYVPTEFSTGTSGPEIADGICEAVGSGVVGARADDDLDCRLADGGFVFPSGGNILNADQLVPHCSPYHNNMCVWYRMESTAVAQDQGGNDYIGPVFEKMGWNTDVDLTTHTLPRNPEYNPGWNNQNDRVYDRQGTDPSNSFKFDTTIYYSVNCGLACAFNGDQSGGSRTKHLNDLVWAAPPNPPTGPDTLESLVPAPNISPFPYFAGLPMLVTFELEHAGTERSDPTALIAQNSVNVATIDPNGNSIPVQFPRGFPTTINYNPFLKLYYIFLSPAPYKTDGTVYTLQIGSDLIQAPINLKFVVKKFSF